MGNIHFRILGPLVTAEAEGREIQFRGHRQQTVMAMLLLSHGEVVSLQKLVTSVWCEGEPPSTAEKQIRNTVSELRQLSPDLEKSIETVIPGYRISGAPESIDSDTFTKHLHRAYKCISAAGYDEARQQLAKALSLCSGSILSGVDSTSVQTRTLPLNENRLLAAEEWADLELADEGGSGTLLGILADLVEDNPYRERMVRQLMLILCQSGSPNRALEIYRRTCSVLLDELGVEPSRSLQDMYYDARAQAATMSDANRGRTTPAKRNAILPKDIPYFIGRSKELNKILRIVEDDDRCQPTIIAIDGMAGVGKTTLAVHVAHVLSENYSRSPQYVNLGTHAHTGSPTDFHTSENPKPWPSPTSSYSQLRTETETLPRTPKC
ncbi:BTAD domain-containing putative transcriptional regulator [Rhodococcus sp. NPDC058521]|uniref:BTAD domain-containing putative transcriptional regulator n=1 Tax=Rhodococcus sp. NPDC058521 TaxID=3346536 RepID=UPI00366484ED